MSPELISVKPGLIARSSPGRCRFRTGPDRRISDLCLRSRVTAGWMAMFHLQQMSRKLALPIRVVPLPWVPYQQPHMHTWQAPSLPGLPFTDRALLHHYFVTYSVLCCRLILKYVVRQLKCYEYAGFYVIACSFCSIIRVICLSQCFVLKIFFTNDCALLTSLV